MNECYGNDLSNQYNNYQPTISANIDPYNYNNGYDNGGYNTNNNYNYNNNGGQYVPPLPPYSSSNYDTYNQNYNYNQNQNYNPNTNYVNSGVYGTSSQQLLYNQNPYGQGYANGGYVASVYSGYGGRKKKSTESPEE